MKILITTHSSRFFDSDRANLNSLNKRFESRTLENLPDLKTFGPWQQAIAVKGKIAFWELSVQQDGRIAPRFIRAFEPPFNPQSVCFVDDVLLIAGPDRIMRYGPGFKELEPFTDNWITGTHTVRKADDGTVWVTSAPANAAIRLDSKTGAVIERLVMPAQYGKGHDLTGADDLRAHFITLDYQPTHINSAVPVGDKLLVSLLVPGVIGVFDAKRNFKEIATGFRGCHGARVHPSTGEYYLTDSPGGMVWFFDQDTLRISRRIDFHSKWLHDAEILADGSIVALPSDRNSVAVMDPNSGEMLSEIVCHRLGRSTIFAQLENLPAGWLGQLPANSDIDSPDASIKFSHAIDLVKPLLKTHEFLTPSASLNECFELNVGKKLIYDYVVRGPDFILPAGPHRLISSVECTEGGIMVGLLDVKADKWIANTEHEKHRSEDWADFQCKSAVLVRLILTASNPKDAKSLRGLIKSIRVAALSGN